MAHLFFSDSKFISGFNFSQHAAVNEILDDPANYCVLLYPGPRATNLTDNKQVPLKDQTSLGRRLVVVVVDGTWHCASRMMVVNSKIAALPQISFSPEHASCYEFRRQPHGQCLSTVEASVQILKLLEPQLDCSAVMKAFQKMVKQQAGFTGYKARQRGDLQAQGSKPCS